MTRDKLRRELARLQANLIGNVESLEIPEAAELINKSVSHF
jgi:hypothetical protein